MGTIRDRLTYSNVMATLAVFVALGGTGYAAFKLPRHSVGPAQLKKGAVKSKAIRDGAIARRDVSRSARNSFGRPIYHAAMNSAGQLVRGNAIAGGNAAGDGIFTIRWKRDVSKCDAAATLASIPGGPVADPPAGSITLRYVSPGVEVHTFDGSGLATDLPFTIVATC